jgi:hypothetical protein
MRFPPRSGNIHQVFSNLGSDTNIINNQLAYVQVDSPTQTLINIVEIKKNKIVCYFIMHKNMLAHYLQTII